IPWAHHSWLSLRLALTARRRSDSLRASSVTRLAANCGSSFIISSMPSALSTATSQGVSVAQAEKRLPPSRSDFSPSMSRGWASAKRRCLPQGCMRSMARVPVSTTTRKLPYSSCRITSRWAAMVANSKKRSTRAKAPLSNCAMYLSLAHRWRSSLPPRCVDRRCAPTSTARASQGTSISSSTPWCANAEANSMESVWWGLAGWVLRGLVLRRLKMPFIARSGMRRIGMPHGFWGHGWDGFVQGHGVVSAGEVFGNLGFAARFGWGDDFALYQVGQVLIQGLHAHAVAGLYRRVHLRHLGLADQVADGAGAEHDFMRRHTARAVARLAQGLRDHGLQRFGQHGADHFFFFGREHVDDPVYGLGGAGGVQRAEYQVAGFSGRHRQADGFQITHFADQDGVGVFAQGRFERGGERQCHRAYFALVDQAFLGLVHEFDRVFHRQDMAVLGFVQEIDHGRQRGRLARAGGAGHQHQPARLERQVGEDPRGVELLERQDFARNRAEHGGHAAVLGEGVDAKARQAFDFKREVDLQKFLIDFALGVAHDVVHHGMHRLVVERIDVDAPHVAVDPDHRRQTSRKVQIRRLVLDAECEQLGNVHGIPPSLRVIVLTVWFGTLGTDHYDNDCYQPPAGRGPDDPSLHGRRARASQRRPAGRCQDLQRRRGGAGGGGWPARLWRKLHP